MQYKFELSLQHMAMGAKAVSLWEQPHIKNKVREFFLREYRSSFREAKEENEEKWTNLTKEVLNQLEPRVLPKILDSELIYVVREVGAKIYNWYEYIKENLRYNVDYAQQIYWTPYGSIDQVKIFKSFWLENSSLSTGNRGVDISKLFRLACNYVLEEHINNLWQQVPKEIQEGTFYTETIYEEYKFHLIAYWQCYLDGDLHYLIRYLRRASRDHDKLYDRNHSVEENMFRLSVSQGYEVAAKHFWGKLNEEEQERNLVSSVHIAIKKYGSYWDIGDYKREQYIEICTFLMSEIKEDRKEKLFEEEITTGIAGGEIFESSTEYRHNILKMFLFSWPRQESFIPTLERMWSYLENSDYQKILYEIVCKISKDYKLGYVVENSKYQRILHEAWNKSPAHFKQEIDQNYYSSDIIGELLNIWDISSIKLIVNDQDTVQRRQELIDKGYKKYTDLIREDKYEILDQFIREILVSEEEQKSFKQKIDIWDYFIRGGRYHLADKLLDWQSSSAEERQNIKDKIDSISICHYFIKEDEYELADKFLNWQSSSAEEKQNIKNKIDSISICHYFIKEDKYELADKFLNWQFATEEEVRNCKNSFKSDKFSYDKIYKLWATFKEDIETARTQSLNFLNWFLDSEEEIAVFKKEKLVNEKLAEILCDSFIGYNRFEIIEDFLDWCLLSPEEIQQLKQVAVDRTIFRKCDYNIANDCLDIAERFIKWAFESEDKRQEFIKEFMLSDDGLRSCDAMIERASDVAPHHPKPTKEEKLEKFKKFIDFWIRPLENLHEVKNKLESYVTYYREEEKIEDHKIFMSLLYNLEQNHDIMEVSYMGESSSMNIKYQDF